MTTKEKVDSTLAKLNTAIGQLQSTASQATCQQILSSVGSSVKACIAHLQENEKKKFIATRKSLVVVSNVIDGALNGLVEEQYSSRKHFLTDVNLLASKSTDIASAFGVDYDKHSEPSVQLTDKQLKAKKSISSDDWHEGLDKIRASLKEAERINLDTPEAEQQRDLSAEVDAANTKYPMRLKSAFTIIRAPVVPIIKNVFKKEVFDKVRIPYVYFEGYAVFRQQVLLMFSKSACERQNLTPLQYAEMVLDTMNDKGSEQYVVVSEKHRANPKNRDLVMFWVLPKSRMNNMMAVFKNGISDLAWDVVK